ncbi:dihydrolipoyl dehydrogenase family protein [Faunimonas sp. B44]|uniref:dihydrolipoyl dehydrogenase family protein n=1 Tax=Faunimonas sp. B44 TaxID=3461493 RepID=UPI004043A801
MPETLTPDICVVGAGSAGLSVAAGAAAFGEDVVLVEKGRMGGDCLNTGCVPSKALIAAAARVKAGREAARFLVPPASPRGIAGEPAVDMAAVMGHVRSAIEAIAPHDSVERFTRLGVRVVPAEARFADAATLIAGDLTIRPRRFVLATGSRPFVPPVPGLADVAHLTNETLFDLTELPRHLLVLGGGPVGLEMAQAFRRLGSDVTVVEAGQPLAHDDPELVAIVLDRLRREGVRILDGSRVAAVTPGASGGIRLDVQTGGGILRIAGTHLLVAAGRRPDLDGLNLEAAGIGFTERGITVDDRLRTSNPRVYAIGDVNGGPQFTHWAAYQADRVLRSILFRFGGRANPDLLPWVTFTDPELASVGLGEDEARRRHGEIRVLRSPFADNDRAQTDGDTTGFAKVITTRRGRVLGAAMVGADAGEMAALWAVAIANRLSASALAASVLPYPTRSDVARRAAVSFYAPLAGSRWTRRAIRLLKAFG